MAETGRGEISSARQVDAGPSVKARVGRFFGVGLAAATLGLGLDQGTAQAVDPTATATSEPVKTPIPAPTVSPTPDATRTAQEALSKDLDEKIKQETERIEREKAKKALDDANTAKQARLDALLTPTAPPAPTKTPTPTPTPNAVATAQAKAFIAQREREFQAADAAAAQATPPPPTATPRPDEPGGRDSTPVPQLTPVAGTDGGSGGFDLGKLVRDNAGLLIGGGVAVIAAKLGIPAIWRKMRRLRGAELLPDLPVVEPVGHAGTRGRDEYRPPVPPSP